MKRHLRILHLEDDPWDAEMVQCALKRAGISCEIRAVFGKEDFAAGLDAGPLDVILSDNSVPGFDGTGALRMARARQSRVPFIFVSGHVDEEKRKRQLEAGANDSVSKSDLAQLAEAIVHCVNESTRLSIESRAAPESAEWYVHAMERLVGVIQELSLARDLTRVMEIVRKSARDLTDADGATFVLRDGDKCFYADEDAIEPLWKGLRFPLNACVSGWAMMNQQPAVIEDIYSDDRVPTDAYRPTFVKSLVMVPIRQREPVGAIGTYWAVRRQPRPEEVRVLQALADSTSVAMENVQLLTGLEQKVKDRTARLESVNNELESFSYSVSHDLRAPLRHVGAYLSMLREDPDSTLSEAGLRFAATVSESARRMEQLIDDLLEFSRMGRVEMMRGRVDMNKLVTGVVRTLQVDTDHRGVFWEIGELPEVEGDEALLRLVWCNLLSNAVNYTGKRERAVIHVGAKPAQSFWQFHVQDNGAGFDNEDADRLFGVFQRLHRADEFEGTGVGLANVRRIVVRHGGRTWAEGRVGEGATFYFTLPANQAASATIVATAFQP